MTLRLPLSEGHRLTLGKPLGLGMPYSLLLTPYSYLPSPPWLPNLYLTKRSTTRQAQISPLATHAATEDQ